MNDYIVFYKHTENDFCTCVIFAVSLTKALKEFEDEHVHKEVYGIMLKE